MVTLLLLTYPFSSYGQDCCNKNFTYQLIAPDNSQNLICGQATWHFAVTNNSPKPITIDHCVFTIEINNSANTYVTYEGISNSTPYFQDLTPTGTTTAQIGLSGTIPSQVSIIMQFDVAFSCDLWDEVFNNNAQALTGHQITIKGFYPDYDCFKIDSDPFDIGYSLVTPNPESVIYSTNLGETFSAEVELAVQSLGNVCDHTFITFVEFGECIDYENATITIEDNSSNSMWPLSQNDITQTATGLQLNIEMPSCLNLDTYDGSYGQDINIHIDGLVMTCCADDGSTIGFSTTTCDENSPATCFTNGELETQGGPTTHFVDVPNGGFPDLDITIDEDESAIKVCSDDQPFYIVFDVCNNSPDPTTAYDLVFNFTNSFGLEVQTAWVNGTEIPVQGGPTLEITFGQYYDLEDVNLDGEHTELSQGNCVEIKLELNYINTSCLFDNYSCPINFSQLAYEGKITWNNQCGTLIPPPQESVNQLVQIISGNGYIDPQQGNLDPILEENTDYTLTACFYDLQLNGWNGVMDQGDFNQSITVSANYPGLVWGNLYYNGDIYPPSGPNNDTYTFPPGTQIENVCVDINFSFTCDQANGPLEISVTSGGYFDDCPDCLIPISCANITLPTICDTTSGTGCKIRTSIKNVEMSWANPEISETRAYPCDHVQMTIEMQFPEDYTGIITAFFDYINTLPNVFENLTISGTINSTPIAMSGPNINGNYHAFPSTNPVSISAGDILSFTIDATVIPNPSINWFTNLDLFRLGVAWDNKECFEYRFFSVLRVISELETSGGGSCCSGAYKYFRVRYTGGSIGEDFPGDNRIIGRFIGDLHFWVDFDLINSITDLNNNNTIAQNVTNYTFSSDILQLNPKTSFTGYAHQVKVIFDPGCGNPANHLHYAFTWTEQDYSNPSACYQENPVTGDYAANVAQPYVHVNFINENLQIHENTATIQYSAWVTNANACFPYIILEYNPNLIQITANNVVSSGSCNGNNYLALEIGTLNIGDQYYGNFEVELQSGSCDEDFTMTLYGAHYCHGGSIPEPLGCPLGCVDGADEALITILESALNLFGFDCTPDAEQCEEHTWSFVINNPGEGDDYDIGFTANIPAGYTLVSGSYDYPYSGSVDNCIASTPLSSSDLQAIQAGTWLIPTGSFWAGQGDGFLPGLSHQNSTSADRTFHLTLTLIGTCDSDPNQTSVEFTAAGTRNCGDQISATFDGNLNYSMDEFIIPEVEITVSDDYNCKEGIGTLSFNINFLDDNLDISPDQIFKLYIDPSFGVSLLCNQPIEFSYGDQTVTCAYQITIDGCRVRAFKIGYTLSTCLTQYCGKVQCETESADLLSGTYYFNPIDQHAHFNEVEISQVFCNTISTQSEQITTCIFNDDAEPGTLITAQLYCDVNENGVLDNGDVLLSTAQVSLGAIGSCVDVVFNISPADFNDACDGGHVIVTGSSPNKCVCIKDNTGVKPECNCVEDVSVVFPDCIVPGEEFCITFNFTYYGPPTTGVSSFWTLPPLSNDPNMVMISPQANEAIPIVYGANSVEVCLQYNGECKNGIPLIVRGDMFDSAGGHCCFVREGALLNCCCQCTPKIEYCTTSEDFSKRLVELKNQILKREGRKDRKLLEQIDRLLKKKSPCDGDGKTGDRKRVDTCCVICLPPDFTGPVWVTLICPDGSTEQNLSYIWNTGSTYNTTIGYAGETYSVTITDNETGCVYEAEETINCPVELNEGNNTRQVKGEGMVNNLTNQLVTYPNPANSSLTVVSPLLNGNRISLVSPYGREIFNSDPIDGKRYSIDVSHFPEGVYYLLLKDDSGYPLEGTKVVILRD